MTTSITITRPDDWHVHLRDEHVLAETVTATARQFRRAIVMPNLVPPVIDAASANAYKQRILDNADGLDFEPLMTLYLTNETTAEVIREAKDQGVTAAKLYPAGATTNSDAAVKGIEGLYPVFEAMQSVGMPLLIHGEVTDCEIDIFDREAIFIERYLEKIVSQFTSLKIVFEHITTKEAVEFVKQAPSNVAATITPQHLLLNRNDLLVGGIRPHNYCLPVLKRNTHQLALREVVASGSTKFFLGTDSAPHATHIKESACGCAGCYSAHSAIELYTTVFEELDALDKLEGFASFYGPDFYGLERNSSKVTLNKLSWTIPETVSLSDGNTVTPFLANTKVDWKLQG